MKKAYTCGYAHKEARGKVFNPSLKNRVFPRNCPTPDIAPLAVLPTEIPLLIADIPD